MKGELLTGVRVMVFNATIFYGYQFFLWRKSEVTGKLYNIIFRVYLSYEGFELTMLGVTYCIWKHSIIVMYMYQVNVIHYSYISITFFLCESAYVEISERRHIKNM